MDVYRQKELYRSELLKQIFNLDASGVTNVLQMTNPYGNFEFTYGLRMIHDLFGAESRLKHCELSKFTLEDVILYMASYTGVWCDMVNKCDALGEIAILLWNAGTHFSNASTVGLMSRTNIPLSGVQRLDTLMDIPDAIVEWTKNWFPNEADLETITALPSVSNGMEAFLEQVVRGRFEPDYDRSYREGILPWSDVFQNILTHGVDGTSAWECYERLSKQNNVNDTITSEDFTLERTRKRRRIN